MTGKMKLYIGLLVLGLVLIGSGTWFFLNPIQRVITPVKVSIPVGNPVIYEKLDYIMRGEFDSLYIYEDGSVIYVEEKGLRMATPGNPATRTWKTGKLPPEELNSLLEFIKNSGFEELNEYYQFPGKPMEPIAGAPGGGFTMGDGGFKFSIDYADLNKTVTAFGYLTPDHGETYPDMSFPLNEIYRRLRIIALQTKEVARENISP